VSDPISKTKIHIRLVRDRPENFIQVLLGDDPNAECACGSTLSGALRGLAERLDKAGIYYADRKIRKTLFPEEE
jgi:hypothetical protein